MPTVNKTASTRWHGQWLTCSRGKETILYIRGLDALDTAQVVDIKSHSPGYRLRQVSSVR